jgi:hypothetical protein
MELSSRQDNSKKRKRAQQLMTPIQNTPMDKRRMAFLRDQMLPPARRTGEDYQSEINRALLKAGAPHWIRIREVKRNDKGTITGMTTDMGTMDDLRKYEAVVIKVARIVDRGIIGFEQNEAWRDSNSMECRLTGTLEEEPMDWRNCRRRSKPKMLVSPSQWPQGG